MKRMGGLVFLLLICCGVGFGAGEVIVYRGASDASAAVAVGGDMFVVADDENNILRVYKTETGGLPEYSYSLTKFLGAKKEYPEVDIEGATRTGNRIYWITSHGRNKDGKMRPNRYRFFATDVEVKEGKVEIKAVGKPCKTLVQDMLGVKALRDLGLGEATKFRAELSKTERQRLAPKRDGLNIEGLCASADGKTIYIGLRNPRPKVLTAENAKNADLGIPYGDKSTKGKGLSGDLSERVFAIVVPLKNASNVVEKGERAVFGEPMLWDLAGLGIRSMEYSAFHKAYFIIAGEHDGGDRFALYKWAPDKEKPVLVRRLGGGDFGPEALIVFEKTRRILLLSDDGTLAVKVRGQWECEEGEYSDGTCPNKFLLSRNKKTFRGKWIEIREP